MENSILCLSSQPRLLLCLLHPLTKQGANKNSCSSFRSFYLNQHDQPLHLHVKPPTFRVSCVHTDSSDPRNGDGAGGGVDPRPSGSYDTAGAPALPTAMVETFTRRFILGTTASLLVGVGGNLGGLTSFLLGFNAELARRLRLDFLYPVDHFLRYFDSEKGFELIYPESWVSDQTLVLRAIERAENARLLDPPAVAKRQKVLRPSIAPVVAFGPPGANGKLNVSVIVAPLAAGIDSLGSAEQVGNFILRNFIAPEGSNKVAHEIDAREREESFGKLKLSYYVLEYSVEAPTFNRHNISVYTSYKGQLFSLSAQSPESMWERNKNDLKKIADSFRLLA